MLPRNNLQCCINLNNPPFDYVSPQGLVFERNVIAFLLIIAKPYTTIV